MKTLVYDAGEVMVSFCLKDADSYALVTDAFAGLSVQPAEKEQGHVLEVKRLSDTRWRLVDHSSNTKREMETDGDLIYHLSDRVIFHLADNTEQRHCLHAAAVCGEHRACVIPAESGAGKSSITAWLVANGYGYLTDELIFIQDDGQISGVARPIQIKQAGVSVIEPLLTQTAQIRNGRFANAVTPENLGGRFAQHSQYPIGMFLFPRYVAGKALELQRLHSAEAGLRLMSNHVNARNLKDHGFRAMMKLIRETPCFALEYGGFHQLGSDFKQTLNSFLSH